MTAYEMRISDWSSDVCSSDLVQRSARVSRFRGDWGQGKPGRAPAQGRSAFVAGAGRSARLAAAQGVESAVTPGRPERSALIRSDTRREGAGCVGTGRLRW